MTWGRSARAARPAPARDAVTRRLTHILAAALTVAAGASILVLMGMIVADVVLRALDPGWRIPGMVDYVEFTLAWLIFLAIPVAILKGQMIAVDLIDTVLPGRALVRLGLLAILVVCAVILWQAIPPALEVREWGERTMDLGWPKFNFFISVWAGMGLSVLAAGLALFEDAGPHT